MNKEEFIGKLQLVYVGDRNAFNEIVEDNQKLKNLLVYSKVEIDRLNNIISELEKTLKQDIYKLDDKENPLFYEDSFIKYATERRLTYMYILDKLKELKEE